MKKKLLAIMFALFLAAVPCLSIKLVMASEVSGNAKAMCLMDFSSGEIVYEKDGDERLPVASMTKMMTLCVIFDEINEERLSLSEKIIASDNAQGMGGSQVFIESGGEYMVEELVKAIIICSANDACVALAERIAGSESGFVSLMNEKAKSLSMTNTHFANCTGLPCVNGYSSAKDMCLVMRELAKNEKYFEYAKIWMEDFVHPKGRITSISNTNKLLKRNIGVDAGKTGYTSEAMHCMTATGKREDTRLIACVIGATTSKERFDLTEDLLSYGFQNYESVAIVKSGEKVDVPLKVKNGKEELLNGIATESYYAFTKKRIQPNENVEITYTKTKAPIKEGEEIGYASVYKDGVEVKRIAIVAEKEVKRKGLFDIFA